MSEPEIVLVVAVAENGVIGRDGALPWRLPGDLKHFKQATIGRPVVMGRKTFESIGRPLPSRSNIVLTRDPTWRVDGVQVALDLDSALAIAAAEAKRLGAREIAVIGGAGVFAEVLPRAHRIELTEVHASPDGDVSFPAFDRNRWREVSRTGPHHAPRDDHPYSFVTLVPA